MYRDFFRLARHADWRTILQWIAELIGCIILLILFVISAWVCADMGLMM